MSASSAVVAPSRPMLRIRGTSYPVLLPSIRDPRLHLAAVIVSLQVLGQTAFGFELSIAQILVALATSALLEVTITFRRQHVIMWPASALLTGNGVAFVLRVPGTEHGDWWSMKGWWIFAGTAAVALLSKHLIRFRGRHFLNPSNAGLVLCFVLLGSTRADPLALWWGPMTPWLVLALAIIVIGALVILSRLHLLAIAVTFWLTFAAGAAVIAAGGHEMTARWHLGPITGFAFWQALVLSPEVMIFLFFMITDPKTTPTGRVGRRVYAVSVAVLALLLIAPQTTEFWTKVALLGALTIVCAARPFVEALTPRLRRAPAFAKPSILRATAVTGAAVVAGALVLAGLPARPDPARASPSQAAASRATGDGAPVAGGRHPDRSGARPPDRCGSDRRSPHRGGRTASPRQGAGRDCRRRIAPARFVAADQPCDEPGDHRPGARGGSARAEPRDRGRPGAPARDRHGRGNGAARDILGNAPCGRLHRQPDGVHPNTGARTPSRPLRDHRDTRRHTRGGSVRVVRAARVVRARGSEARGCVPAGRDRLPAERLRLAAHDRHDRNDGRRRVLGRHRPRRLARPVRRQLLRRRRSRQVAAARRNAAQRPVPKHEWNVHGRHSNLGCRRSASWQRLRRGRPQRRRVRGSLRDGGRQRCGALERRTRALHRRRACRRNHGLGMACRSGSR